MTPDTVKLDGSFGEGGGQILRTALSLSMLTGRPFRIDRIRAGRDKPGLLRQHLTAVRAAGVVCQASISGDELGSMSIEFTPRSVSPGDYRFSIGTAGSTMLVVQTLLPPLLMQPIASTIMLEGGTHNTHAPTADFLNSAFLPILFKMGARIDFSLHRYGFYPAGGGCVSLKIDGTSSLTPLSLLNRGRLIRVSARALIAGLPTNIATRELDVVAQKLIIEPDYLRHEQLDDSCGPGNVVRIEIESESVTEMFTGFGRRGVRAETVAGEVADEARAYLAAGAPVGEYLADQLLLPMALAGGGEFRTGQLSNHTTTNARVIERFLPVRIDTVPDARTTVVRVETP